MSDPYVAISFDDDAQEFMPGETISGQFKLESFDPGSVKAIEFSVLWYTEGKGDEDLDVHEFRRIEADDMNWSAFRRAEQFDVTLPLSPLSYEGSIMKIRWCARVRVFPKRGREIVAELPFVLGNLQPARPHAG
ncbi:MAG: hypothetical protein JXM70_18145 [Pirellulales bacterium]|nr:hypothetical protein [Pirellulales bacterium]